MMAVEMAGVSAQMLVVKWADWTGKSKVDNWVVLMAVRMVDNLVLKSVW